VESKRATVWSCPRKIQQHGQHRSGTKPEYGQTPPHQSKQEDAGYQNRHGKNVEKDREQPACHNIIHAEDDENRHDHAQRHSQKDPAPIIVLVQSRLGEQFFEYCHQAFYTYFHRDALSFMGDDTDCPTDEKAIKQHSLPIRLLAKRSNARFPTNLPE